MDEPRQASSDSPTPLRVPAGEDRDGRSIAASAQCHPVQVLRPDGGLFVTRTPSAPRAAPPRPCITARMNGSTPSRENSSSEVGERRLDAPARRLPAGATRGAARVGVRRKRPSAGCSSPSRPREDGVLHPRGHKANAMPPRTRNCGARTAWSCWAHRCRRVRVAADSRAVRLRDGVEPKVIMFQAGPGRRLMAGRNYNVAGKAERALGSGERHRMVLGLCYVLEGEKAPRWNRRWRSGRGVGRC